MISSAFARLYATIASTGMQHYQTTTNLTTQSTALPADFLSLVGVDYVVSATTGERRALRPLMVQERNLYRGTGTSESLRYAIEGVNIVLYPAPVSGQTYVLTYIPQPTDLSASADGTSVDVVTPDGEEAVIWGAAALALAKEESDTSVARQERELALERVREWAIERMLTEPRRHMPEDELYEPDPGEYRWPYR